MSSLHLSVTPATHIFYRRGEPSTWRLPTPATRQLPPLFSVPRAVGLRLLSFLRPFYPRYRPRPAPSSLSAPGYFPIMGPSAPLCPCFYLSFCDPLPRIFWLLFSSFGCPFRVRTRGQGASNPCQSPAPAPTPFHLATPVPSGYPSPPPPLPAPRVVLIPSPRLKSVGRDARSWNYVRMIMPC